MSVFWPDRGRGRGVLEYESEWVAGALKGLMVDQEGERCCFVSCCNSVLYYIVLCVLYCVVILPCCINELVPLAEIAASASAVLANRDLYGLYELDDLSLISAGWLSRVE